MRLFFLRRGAACASRVLSSRGLRAAALSTLLARAVTACGETPDQDVDVDESKVAVSGAGKQPGAKSDGGTSRPPASRDEPEEEPDEPEQKPRQNPDECAAIEKSTPAGKTAVDVIVVIDTSGSMLDEVLKVQANISKFMTDFAAAPADTRVVMVTNADPAGPGVDRARYRFVPAEVGSGLLYTTLGFVYATFADFLRPNAFTHLVMISDADDFVPGPIFQDSMKMTLGHDFVLHSVVSEAGPLGGCALGNVPGGNYSSVAKATGGIDISICTEDWSTVFAELQKAVVEAVPLPCDYPLTEAKGKDFDPLKLQFQHTPEGGKATEFPKAASKEQCRDNTGWYYDDGSDPKNLHLCPRACEAVRTGGKVEIVLGCPATPIVI